MDNFSQNINIDKEMKIDNSPAPRPNDDTIRDENINPNQFQYQSQNENKGIIRQQKIIKKKFDRHVKQESKKNMPQQQTDTGLISDENLDHPMPLVSDYYEEGKDDILQNFKKKKELENNKAKKEEIKNLELDKQNLEENREKQLDEEVIKKLENSFGNHEEEVKVQVKSVDNDEKNERRPDSINDNIVGMKNGEKDNLTKEKHINNKSEYSLDYNPFREQVSYKNVNYNESVKNKIKQSVNNTGKKIIVEENKKVNSNEINKNLLNTSIEQRNKDISNNIKFNNINNANTEQKVKYYSNSKKQASSSKVYTNPNSYTKSRPNQRQNINSCVRRISYGESTLEKKQQIPKYQNRIPSNNNHQKNVSNNSTYVSSNIKDKKPINKIPKAPINNKKYFKIENSIPINEYNSTTYQNKNSINNEYFDDMKSLDSQITGAQLYQKDIQFNNVQTTYVVYSKKEKNEESLSNRNPFKNMNKSQNINSSCLESKTPVKTSHINKNSCPIGNNNKSYSKNNNEYSFKNYEYRSPYVGNQKFVSRIPLSKTNDSSMNKSQNTLQVRRRFDYNDIDERNTYDIRPKNYENNFLSGNPFVYNNQYPVDSRNKRINNNPMYNNYNYYQYDYRYNYGDEIPRNMTYDLNANSNYNSNYNY